VFMYRNVESLRSPTMKHLTPPSRSFLPGRLSVFERCGFR
jgi:hypothetical protein